MAALVRAHQRHVDVRIMLNPHRSSGDRANDESFKALRHAGLKVEWSNPAFAVTHEKSLVIDDTMALISTFNYATKYFTETRDYGIVTTQPQQVAEVIAGFEADWHRKDVRPRPRIGPAVELEQRPSAHGVVHRYGEEGAGHPAPEVRRRHDRRAYCRRAQTRREGAAPVRR
jgi:phosphatidylserine/phosphatidylglycerophosphate/cardiolipin synthase-like enzyme